ncbi:MAG TPA: hypothetical protein VLU41_02480, partial [Ideonella sp.]|nr:hypothetical protein [Ideonella sp.]
DDIHPLAIIVPIAVTIVLLVIRLFILLRVRHRRQRENRQETERLRSLVVAYRSLAGSFTPATGDHRVQLEEALADIVLFGTLKQVEMAAACATAVVRGEAVVTQPLAEELRADLRNQLGLEPIPPTLEIPPSGPGPARIGPRGGRGDGEGARAAHGRWRPPDPSPPR